MQHRVTFAAFAIVLACTASAAAASRVYSNGRGILFEHDGTVRQLTRSRHDRDPALSPGGTVVVYTRQGDSRDNEWCTNAPRPDELREVNIDGTGDKLLLSGRKGGPQQQLCDFAGKQFSSDGRRLYFLTPGWATSGALHIYDMRTGEERFLLPANGLLVLSFCPNAYKDDLVIQSHRYFVFGGSYDWYWLYDPTGKKELGPLGEFDSPDAVVKEAREDWCHP